MFLIKLIKVGLFDDIHKELLNRSPKLEGIKKYSRSLGFLPHSSFVQQSNPLDRRKRLAVKLTQTLGEIIMRALQKIPNKQLWLTAVLSITMFTFNANANANNDNQAITLKDPKKITDASALNEAIDTLSAKVMACVDKKLAPQEKCFCLYPAEIHDFKLKYQIAVKNNPEWHNKVVSWSNMEIPMGYSLVFPTLKVQVEMKCNR